MVIAHCSPRTEVEAESDDGAATLFYLRRRKHCIATNGASIGMHAHTTQGNEPARERESKLKRNIHQIYALRVAANECGTIGTADSLHGTRQHIKPAYSRAYIPF